ncbi:Calmodulin-binding domain plant [Arabidopsis suecica]|uniref:Calmodulin-binding domain plant n=1 Tax=Arabidopsis suecica TaxID=45249 RepID=A0A8T1ZBH7_ARASU|nr:Calmodulin-binding domain plant [Arabidopsis suecica]KAG7555365.1 Calmodulin-binding domain plant [Arabidopsis suecica]
MAEETVRLPNSPDVNRSWRRISTGKLSFLYTEEKVLPNYLRSPTGSCHDACKYGRKHESEEKPRVPHRKRVNRSFSGTLNLDSPLRKKALTKPVLSPSFGSGKYDSVGGSADHAKSEVRNFSSGVCDVEKNHADRTNEKVVPFSESQLADSTKRKKKKKKKTVYVSRGRAKEIVEHNRRVTALKLKSVAQTAAIALRRSTVKRKKMNGGAEPKKAVTPLRRASMSSKRCSRCLKRKKESNSLSVPLMKTRKHVGVKCKDLVEEKTLYVIKMEKGDEIVESEQNQRCVMDSPTDDPKSEKSQDEAECIETEPDNESSQEEEEEDENVFFSEDKSTTREGKSKALSAESVVNGNSTKLRIKRGKIIDFGLQGNSPRKLKFKRGKIVSGVDTTSKSGGRRRLKTKGTNFSNDKEQQRKPRVVLKHQETQKKREARVLLFNKVIKETANKLVQTRKSKVKALVGAFESVISLQEKTSSATI